MGEKNLTQTMISIGNMNNKHLSLVYFQVLLISKTQTMNELKVCEL